MLTTYEIPYISKVFEQFAEMECKGKSNLYYQLAHQIAKDETILALCKHCKARQPIPNLLFGAVHYLLLKSDNEEIATYYPSISDRESEGIPYDLFKSFCLKNEDEIKAILATRLVQTNAVKRTAYLMPIISSLYKQTDKLAVVDIGTSSGLVLSYDRYSYHYKGGATCGQGAVRISSVNRKGSLPFFQKIKRAKRKIGIDQNILDLRKQDNSLWLKALIWPDLVDRFKLMASAIEEFRSSGDMQLIKANSISEFEEVITNIPEDEALFIYHTHVLYQFTADERSAFRKMLDKIGKSRDFNYLAVEGGGVFDVSSYPKGGEVFMELTTYKAKTKKARSLGRVDAHGRWIEWSAF